MPLTITILLYESDRTFEQIPFILKLLMGHWETFGHHIRVQRGLAEPLCGDVVIPHLSLTQIPQPYQDCLQAHPRVLNRRLMDTSKRRVSRHLLALGDPYQGPVIVKTNANYGGRDELRLGLGPTPPALGRVGRPWRRLRRWLRQDTHSVDWSRVTTLDPNQYPLFPNLVAVPRAILTNPHLIVEKFLPEREGDLYCLRNWIGLGDVGENVRAFSKLPIVKAAVAFGHTPISMPAELTAWRQAIGMDYGKIDYVMPAGRLVVLDVNPTPTYRGPDPHPLLQAATQSMAQALARML